MRGVRGRRHQGKDARRHDRLGAQASSAASTCCTTTSALSIAGGDASPTEITEEAFDRVTAINLRGCVMAVKHVLPVMRAQQSGRHHHDLVARRLRGLSLRRLQGDQGGDDRLHPAGRDPERAIRRPRQLHPAGTDGHADGGRHPRPRDGKPRAEIAAARDAKVPLRGKMGTAWDVANAALFLASDEANFITGVALAGRWRRAGQDRVRRLR